MAPRTATFFRNQHRARRKTALLVVYLLLAVGLIVLAVNAVLWAIVVASDRFPGDLAAWLGEPWWQLASAATVAVVLIGSVTRYFGLRGGGRAVAEMMGARRLDTATRDLDERRLVNVVEEMAIASGTPVPALYVMDEEPGINAFVAGYRPTEAVMVVTRGAIAALSRDELQGVVAHEYSHILNGDMRLNVRLMAILAGILSIGIVGRVMMRALGGTGRRTSRVRSSGSGRGGAGQAQVALFVFGLALFVIGYIGLFFGRLIKAAVSRQREFLADASSVQFTRNPPGIAGALWKIREHVQGSLLGSAHAEDTSHMCFGQSVVLGFTGLLATHPPIDARIQAVDPHFKGRKAAETIRERGVGRPYEEPVSEPGGRAGFGGALGFAAGAAAVTASVGNPTPAHVAHAVRIRESLPDALVEAAHEPRSARHLMYAMVLGDVRSDRERVARALLTHQEGAGAMEAVESLTGPLSELEPRQRLPLVDVAIPALKRLSTEQREAFLSVLEKLIRVDRTVTLFEFAVQTLVGKHLAEDAERADRVRYTRFEPVLPQIRILLTLLARAGSDDEAAAREAYAVAMRNFTQVTLEPADPAYARPEGLGRVLDRLSGLSPLLKEPLLVACVDCVTHDGLITVEESELLRAVAEALDCPMPPLLQETLSAA